MLTEKMIKALEEKGFNRWQKGDKDRLYINAENLGLELSYYKSGNVSGACLDGERISNAEGRRLKCEKTYIDVATGELHGTHETLTEKAQAIYDEVAKAVSTEEEKSADDTDVEALAQAVRESTDWSTDAAEKLCAAASLQEEWYDAFSSDELKAVILKAAEILGVDLRVYKDELPVIGIEYQAGPSAYDAEISVDWMSSDEIVDEYGKILEDEDGDELHLYAEMENPSWHWVCRIEEVVEGTPPEVIKVYDGDVWPDKLHLDGEYEDEDGNMYIVESRDCDDECATEQELAEEIRSQAIRYGIDPSRLYGSGF